MQFYTTFVGTKHKRIMILTNIENCSRYESLHPLFKQLFDYVRTNELLNMPIGRIELDGDNLFINNSEPECVPQEEQKLEVHKVYTDVHILLEGNERIGWASTEELSQITTPYDEEGDYMFYGDVPLSWVDLTPGQIFIAYPEDAHAPIVGKVKIRKAIAKLKIPKR